MTQRARYLSFITLILILAAATRIINVGSWPVWTDEGWSIWATDDAHVDVVLTNLAHDRHPPLYFVALRGWRSLAGDSPLALRYLSIAAGLLTVAVAYRTAADVFGRRAGVYTAALLAVLPVAVYYSQEVRHYGAFVLFAALSWLCFLRYLRRPRVGMLPGYLLSLTLAFYTLYFAILPLAVQMVVGLLWQYSRKHTNPLLNPPPQAREETHPKRGLIVVWIAAAVLYAPWLWVIATIQFPTLTTGIGSLPGTYAATAANLPALGELLLGTQWALLAGLAAIGLAALGRFRTAPRRWVVVAAGIGLFVIMFILSLKFNLLSGRTLVFLVPMLVIVCGYGASVIDRVNAPLPNPSPLRS